MTIGLSANPSSNSLRLVRTFKFVAALQPFTVYLSAVFTLYPVLVAYGLLASIKNRSIKVVASNFDILALLLALASVFFRVGQLSPTLAINQMRYFYGFVFVYFLVKQIFRVIDPKTQLDVAKALLFISIGTQLIEPILVNTFTSLADTLGNYPNLAEGSKHKTQYFGFYQRPYGLAAIHSGSAAILVSLLAFFSGRNYVTLKFRRTVHGLGAVAIALCGSGVGYVTYAFYIGMTQIRKFSMTAAFGLIAVISMPFVAEILQSTYRHSGFFYRASASYWARQLEVKSIRIFEDYPLLDFSWVQLLVGKPLTPIESTGVTHDTAWIPFFYHNGLIGLLALLAVLVPNLNRMNLLPIAILAIANIHYPTIFTTYGSLVFAVMLCCTNQVGTQQTPRQAN